MFSVSGILLQGESLRMLGTANKIALALVQVFISQSADVKNIEI